MTDKSVIEVKHYAERELESDREQQIYVDHICAMTTEELHCKSAIAAELAYRDYRIEKLESQDNWISVEDRLPEFNIKSTGAMLVSQDYLVSLIFSSRVYVGSFRKNTRVNKTFWIGNFPLSAEVTHWQQLPEPPKEHNWVNAYNQVMSGAEICTKCLTVRAKPKD